MQVKSHPLISIFQLLFAVRQQALTKTVDFRGQRNGISVEGL